MRPILFLGLTLTIGPLGCSPLPEATAQNDGELSTDALSTDDPTAKDDVIPPPPPTYEAVTLPAATIHVVTIPDPVAYPVRVGVTKELTPVDAMAAQMCDGAGCVAVLNAGFFDPNNGLTTSPVVVNGELLADPTENERLIGNPDLAPYMDQILNRSEFRRYDCDGTPRYAITRHQDPLPTGCTLQDSVGAGPQLLPSDTSVAEAFVDPSVSPVRDALGSQSPNARSALGITADGSILLVMVAQVPGVSPSGLSLPQVADFLAERGAVQALNLDGGSSATLIYNGTTHYGRLNADGEWVQRPVKSILWVAAP